MKLKPDWWALTLHIRWKLNIIPSTRSYPAGHALPPKSDMSWWRKPWSTRRRLCSFWFQHIEISKHTPRSWLKIRSWKDHSLPWCTFRYQGPWHHSWKIPQSCGQPHLENPQTCSQWSSSGMQCYPIYCSLSDSSSFRSLCVLLNIIFRLILHGFIPVAE